MGIGGRDIDLPEKMLAHEIAIALGMFRPQAHVFVEVDRAHPAKAQIPLCITVAQLLVSAYGRRACGQPQHASRVDNHMGGDNIGRAAAHSLIIFGAVDPHSTFSLSI